MSSSSSFYFYSKVFFTNILRLLDEQGMTKSELAELADMSNSFLTDITLDNGNPSLKKMSAISDALGEPLTAMLETTDLDKETIDALAGTGKPLRCLPDGYVRLSVILTNHQAFIARLQSQENRKKILNKKNLLGKRPKRRRLRKKNSVVE